MLNSDCIYCAVLVGVSTACARRIQANMQPPAVRLAQSEACFIILPCTTHPLLASLPRMRLTVPQPYCVTRGVSAAAEPCIRGSPTAGRHQTANRQLFLATRLLLPRGLFPLFSPKQTILCLSKIVPRVSAFIFFSDTSPFTAYSLFGSRIHSLKSFLFRR